MKARSVDDDLHTLLTTLLEFHYRMLGFLEKVLTDFALHGLPW